MVDRRTFLQWSSRCGAALAIGVTLDERVFAMAGASDGAAPFAPNHAADTRGRGAIITALCCKWMMSETPIFVSQLIGGGGCYTALHSFCMIKASEGITGA